MARRKRTNSNTPVFDKGVEIKRNSIEAFLMILVRFIRSKKKNVLLVIILLILIFSGIIFGGLYYENYYNTNLLKYEELKDRYDEIKSTTSQDDIKKLIDDLKAFEKDASGSFKNLSCYLIGNLSYKVGSIKDAGEYYEKFIEDESTDPLSLIARVNIAISYQKGKQFDKALEIFKKLENEYANKSLENYVIFNFANFYASKDDIKNARVYYNKLISLYPRSFYAREARKLLLQLSVK